MNARGRVGEDVQLRSYVLRDVWNVWKKGRRGWGSV